MSRFVSDDETAACAFEEHTMKRDKSVYQRDCSDHTRDSIVGRS